LDENFKLTLEYDPSPDNIGNNFGRVYHKATDKILLGQFIIDSDENITGPLTHAAQGSACRCPSFIADPDKYVLGKQGNDIYLVDMENETASVETTNPNNTRWGVEYINNYLFTVSDSKDATERGIWRYDGTSWTRVVSDGYYMRTMRRHGTPKYNPQFFLGFDTESAIVQWTLDGTSFNKYRLPVSTPGFEGWRDTAMRSRLTQRIYLVTCAKILYRFPHKLNIGTNKGVPNGFRPKPICSHQFKIMDMINWMGLLGIGRGENYPQGHRTGQPNSGLTFVNEEDLWSWGEPRGYGAVWRNTSVGAGETSDPFLINGFDKKTIHLETDAATDYTIQVDPIGDGSFKDYDTVSFSGAGYDTYIMTGDAIWCRIKSDKAVTATAWFNLR